jgi:dihydroxyacetone kinase-like predicted kinase
MAKKDCFNAGILVGQTIRGIADAWHDKNSITTKQSLEGVAVSAKHLTRVVDGKAKREATAVMRAAARLSKQKAPKNLQVSKLLERAKKLRTSVATSCKTIFRG